MAFTPEELQKIEQFKATRAAEEPIVSPETTAIDTSTSQTQVVPEQSQFERIKDRVSQATPEPSQFDRIKETQIQAKGKEEERKTDLNSVGNRLGLPVTDLQTGGEEFKAALAGNVPEEPTVLGGIAEALTATFGGEKLGETIAAATLETFSSPGKRAEFDDLKAKLIESHPDRADELNALNQKQLVNFPDIGELILDAGEVLLDVAGGELFSKSLKLLKGTSKSAKVAKAILPKRTPSVESEALQKGLFKKPTLGQKILGGKRAISPSEELIADADVISSVIKKPKVKNLQEFIGQIKTEGANIRNTLRPKLKEVNISGSRKELKALGKEIEEDVLLAFEDLPSADKKAFGKFLKKLDTSKNLDDLWSARIEWDNWLPKAVKQAGTGSDAKLLTRQDVWLQNRSKVNDLISKLAPEDIAFKTELNKMRALINAQGNIASKGSEFAKIKGLIPKGAQQAIKTGAVIAALASAGGAFGFRLARGL